MDKTLAGDTDQLKERTLGIEIFGKDADYDTAADPIVRVTAGEIRKRIALYYQEPGHEQELRISLPLGSYIPQFHPAGAESGAEAAEPETHAVFPAASEAPAVTTEPEIVPRGRFFTIAWIAVAVAGLLLAVALFFVWRNQRDSVYAQFWNPLFSSGDPILFCVADQPNYTTISLRDADNPDHAVILNDTVTAVVIDDLSTITRIAGALEKAGRRYSLRGESSTALMDLRAGPSVIIGAFDNAWTLRLLQPLRYHFANDPDMMHFSIVDGTSADKTVWTVDRKLQLATNNYRDYAIVARFTDTTTGKPTLVAAGIGRGGTIAAGDFVTSPTLLRSAYDRQPPGKHENMEVVLSTQIINGEPGTPTIEAVYFW